ncbi:MAG: Wzz/FepE/Etk N-terminal domain-containing protein [Pseudomonadota bacterium]
MSSSEHQSHQPSNQEIEIDLKELITTIWQGRWKIAIITIITIFLGAFYAFSQINVYRADALLAPVAEESTSALSSIGGSLGGLAGLAGIDLGSAGIDKKILGIETLKSRAFLQNFIQKYDLLIPLLGSKGWDEESKTWIINPEEYNIQEKKWINYEKEPSLLIAYSVFEKYIDVIEDAKTGIVELTVDSYSPKYAKEWAENLVHEVNNYLRKQDVIEAKRSIEFLEEQLSKNQVSEMQTVLYQLVEQQTKTMMLAEVRNGYVFRVIDPPVIPEEKVKPRRGQILVLSAVLGLALGMFFVFFSNKLKKDFSAIEVKK